MGSHFVLLTIYDTGDQIKESEMGGEVVGMRDRRGAYMVVVGRPEGRKILGRPRRR
jgi:hypothetical protein